VRAGDLVAAWRTDFLADGSALHWLLEPVGMSGETIDGEPDEDAPLRAEERILQICPARETPDLPDRLRHPALWLQKVDPVTGAPFGPGPFRQEPDGTLTANPTYPGAGPYVEKVVPLLVEGHSPMLFRLGDAHAAVIFGQGANALIDDPESGLRLERLPDWDRTYFVWMNPEKRWVNDPVFRRWVAGTIDRDEMVSYLFDERGERAFSLSRGGSAVPVYPLRADRPLSPMTEPRLQMVYDVADPYSEAVAQRLQAVLASERVELSLVAMDLTELRSAMRAGQVDVALMAHHPGSEDPVLALEGTIWWLGPGTEEAWEGLVAASRIDPRQLSARAAAAWKAEELLLKDARVVPLIRLHAWLAHRPSLTGLDPGPEGELRLEEAWWLP
jgi:MarR-like DNA-binding transcriptional regulator SgrR of sgrS sRNA